MEKKNTVLLTIIAVATLLVAVVGATFAYFTAQNGASGSTTATVTTETIGAITVSNEDPALYLDLTAAQMQEGATGSYWATKTKGAEPATNYASADKAVIAKLNVSGGGEETVYSCNFKITVDKTDVTLAYGDAAVVFALENNAEILGVTSGSEIDYTTLLNEYTVNFTRVGDTEEDLPLVSVSMRVSNTEVEQGFAGETLTTTFTSSDLECEVVDESDVKTLSGTWRFNDELTYNGNISEDIDFEFTTVADGVAYRGVCSKLLFQDESNALPEDYTPEHHLYYYGVSIEPSIDLGVDLPAYVPVYYNNWYDSVGEGVKTITFTEEQIVSNEFYEWFTANATEVVTRTLSGTWLFTDNPDIVGDELAIGEYVNFVSNEKNYIAMSRLYHSTSDDLRFYYSESEFDTVLENGDTDYYLNGWADEAYKIVSFIGEQRVSNEFYEWFTAVSKPVTEVAMLPTENINPNAIYKTYEYIDIDNTNPTTIGAGTYRFNDSIIAEDGANWEQDINFYFELSSYDTIRFYCTQISIFWEGYNTDFNWLFYNISSVSPSEIEIDGTVYDVADASGLNVPGEIAVHKMSWYSLFQIITIPNDAEVSSEFGSWFVENAKVRGEAKYYQYIDGSWVEQ